MVNISAPVGIDKTLTRSTEVSSAIIDPLCHLSNLRLSNRPLDLWKIIDMLQANVKWKK